MMRYSSPANGILFAESLPADFINRPLLWLLVLVAVPVILHLLLRHKPKKLLFPALRLIQQRRKNNVRRLRLKHLWLLLLRMLVLAALVVAWSRPTLPAANYSPNGREWLTIAGVVLVAMGAYYGVLFSWRRKKLPGHVLHYRRSFLRAGTGVATALLLLLLFVWPYSQRVFAEIESPAPPVAETQPVAAVFVFDTGPAMGYVHQNRNRLQAAAHIAQEHLEAMTRGSQVAIATTGQQVPILFHPDLAAVRKRLQQLQVTPVSRQRLVALIGRAVEKQAEERKKLLATAEADRFVREVYVFTDLTRSGWSPEEKESVREQLRRHPWLPVYLIDVGIAEPTNVSLSGLRLSQPSVIQSEELYVDVTVRCSGARPVKRTLKLHFLDRSGQRTVRDSVVLSLQPGEETSHRFALGQLVGPFQQGEVRIEEPDPLEVDNARFFTVAVHPQPEVLIVSDSRSDAFLWQQALAPEDLPADQRWFRCTYLPTTKLSATDLSRFDAVYLINVRQPTDALWKTLADYVKAGGGAGVVLGMPHSPQTLPAYHSETALQILPAKLLGQLPHTPWAFLELTQRNHPLFTTFRQFGTGPLTQAPVRQYWRVAPLPGAEVLARYTDRRQAPALLVRSVEAGRTVLFTTAVGRKNNWNDLALAGWRYQELAHRITRFLTGFETRSYNFEQGEVVQLSWSRQRTARPSLLKKPTTQIRLNNSPRRFPQKTALDHSVVLDAEQLNEVGHYQLRGDDEERSLLAAFSHNLPAGRFDLRRLSREELDGILGKGRYQVARTPADLQRLVQAGRLGREVFPLLVGLLLLIFCGEMFVANRFYEAEQTPEQPIPETLARAA